MAVATVDGPVTRMIVPPKVRGIVNIADIS
jgi:hypothetical protein